MIMDLDAITRNELASMVYSRWNEAFSNAKLVKTYTWEHNKRGCPKEDWELFHNEMIKNAERELKLATKLRDDVCKFSPLILGE